MTPRKFIIPVLFIVISMLSACGGRGGGSSNFGGTIDLKATKAVALDDGSDSATVQATVENADGTVAPDGTIVTFSASDSTGPLSSATAATVNGKVSFSLTHAPITGATHLTATITASAGGVSASQDVKFITQPSSVDVFVAFNQAVTNLAGLQFNLNNTAGATFDNNAQKVFAINNAANAQTLIACHFNAAANATSIGLANGSGFDTGTDPIIKLTFAVTSGLPSFTVDPGPANFTATSDANGSPTTPPVTAANLVVTVKYDTEN